MHDRVGSLDRNVILDKQVSSGEAGTEDELGDLKGGKGSLYCQRDFDVERG